MSLVRLQPAASWKVGGDGLSLVMDRKTKGHLGEAQVISKLVELGFSVFVPLFNNEEIDLIAIKNNEVFRFSVKSTTVQRRHDTWSSTIKNVSRRKDTIAVKLFNNEHYDVLAIFIIPLNKVLFFDSKKIDAKTEITFNVDNDHRFWKYA